MALDDHKINLSDTQKSNKKIFLKLEEKGMNHMFVK